LNFAVTPPPSVRAGAGRRDITPPADTPLIGYTERHTLHPAPGHGGVLDPLFATVLVLEDDARRLVLVSLDLCILETQAATRLRATVATTARTSPAHVVLACSHTHSGPFPWDPAWPASPVEDVGPGILGPRSAAYFAQLSAALADATAAALADLAPATLRSAETDLPHAYRRRVPLPDGSVGHAWNLRDWTGPAPAPAADPRLVLLTVERASRPPLLVWNAAAHPVTLGKHSNLVSADWPGAVRARLESAHPGALTLFLNGASGDAHPFLATGRDPADLDLVAAPVAAALLALLATTPSAPPPACPSSFDLRHSSFRATFTDLPLAAWTLGGAARLLSFPGELFGADGAALRRARPLPLLLAATADGWTGYWPPANEYPLGGYECDSAPRKDPADHAALLAAAYALLG
jgi:hypothetical protein